MNTHADLVLCRSDAGDGGWSLHAAGSSDEAIASGDAPALASGPSDYDEDAGEWLRPNEDDHATARIACIVREALAEDEREGSHFDAEGFSNFCPEETPEDIRAAWLLYDRIVFGGEPAGIIAVITASIATNDPENDPTPRLELKAKRQDGKHVWVDADGNVVADGKTADEALHQLMFVYGSPEWDLRV